jgi:hypothetical protein
MKAVCLDNLPERRCKAMTGGSQHLVGADVRCAFRLAARLGNATVAAISFGHTAQLGVGRPRTERASCVRVRRLSREVHPSVCIPASGAQFPLPVPIAAGILAY